VRTGQLWGTARAKVAQVPPTASLVLNHRPPDRIENLGPPRPLTTRPPVVGGQRAGRKLPVVEHVSQIALPNTELVKLLKMHKLLIYLWRGIKSYAFLISSKVFLSDALFDKKLYCALAETVSAVN